MDAKNGFLCCIPFCDGILCLSLSLSTRHPLRVLGWTEIVGLVFHEHLIFDFVRMDREFLLVLSDAEHSLWVLGSSALVPDLKRLSLLLE